MKTHADSDKAERRRLIDSLGASLHRELQKNAFRMRLDCLGSDTQLTSDSLVGEPVAHKEHDGTFARRQGAAWMLHLFRVFRGVRWDDLGLVRYCRTRRTQ